jgi:hypothetical protein
MMASWKAEMCSLPWHTFKYNIGVVFDWFFFGLLLLCLLLGHVQPTNVRVFNIVLWSYL